MRLHVNCECAIGTRLNLDLLFIAQNGVVLELCRTAAIASLIFYSNHHEVSIRLHLYYTSSYIFQGRPPLFHFVLHTVPSVY